MAIDPPETSIENEAAKILQPIDDLVGKEGDQLKQADEKIEQQEDNTKKLFPPAKRHDEE
jgi:hypothetical protein